MKTTKMIVLPLLVSGLLFAGAARADMFTTAIGGGVGAVAGAVVGDSMGGRRGAIIGSGVGGAMGAVVGQQMSSQPVVYSSYPPPPPVRSYGVVSYAPVYERRVDHYYYEEPHRHHHGHGWGHDKHHHGHYDGYRH